MHVVVVQRGREMYKKTRCTCKVAFLLTETYYPFAVLVAVAVDFASAPCCCTDSDVLQRRTKTSGVKHTGTL